MVAISTELQKSRQNLLDLTMRNRLLNYRQTSARSIRVIDELPAEIYDALVLREKTLEFRGTGVPKRGDAGSQDSTPAYSPAPSQCDEWRLRSAGEIETQHTDRYLQTPYDDEALAKKLFRVYHEGRSAVEEQGYTVVHLAIGFLEWYESDDSDQARRAPLVLIPVELERVRAGDFSKLRWTGEDVFVNISLAAKLAEQGVALPPFEAPEEKSGIDTWLQKVVDSITRKQRWRVLSEMTLDFFSFTKFVMFKDLDPATWPADKNAEDHPLVQSLFNPQGPGPSDDGFDEREIDRKLTARDLWHVRDADPSQIAVIEDVKAGRNLVVQGPPGTGKSQTITNVIAEALAAGKTVLFVSEKMAALDVVKNRLDEAGLGPFCLELHSRKANKKAVLLELQRALKSQSLPPVGDGLLDEHETLKCELNAYASDLATPIGRVGRAPYDLFSDRQRAIAHFERARRPIPPLPRILDPDRLSETDLNAAVKALRDLAAAIPLVRPASAHPWRYSTLDAMLPFEEEELRESIASTATTLQSVVSAACDLVSVSGVMLPPRLSAVDQALRAAAVMAAAPESTNTTILLNHDWDGPNTHAAALVDRVETLQRARVALLRTFTEPAVASDLTSQLDEFRPLAVSLWRIFNGRYRALRKELAATYSGPVPSTSRMCADLEQLSSYHRERAALRGDATGPELFGSRWHADASDCDDLRAFTEWIVAFRRELLAAALTDNAVPIAIARSGSVHISPKSERLRSLSVLLREQIEALLVRIRLEPIDAFGGPVSGLAFEDLAAMLVAWRENCSALFRWAQFNAARTALRRTAGAALEPLATDDRLDESDVLPLFQAAFAESLLRSTFRERPALASFVGELHERKIARFREIDGDLVKLNRARLSRRLHDRRPQVSSGATRTSEVGILLGEFNRRRAHMPIRKLLSQAGGLIQRIKPCFLMSPLSIAQFLDPRIARFNLIVFDEASQVRPEDAVGALLRGEQLVVMGDTQQLPPTSFFDHLTDTEEVDDDSDEPQGAAITDVESILHQCARSYPSKMLNWHYRSRHESLIAVSNLHFYDNQLHIYPSVIDRADEIGLHFVHMPHTIYDRGKSSTNRLEAQAVAAAAVDHFRRFPAKSLGVGTFNIKQQQAILEEVELQLKAHPEMEPFFKSERREHFFVKNLETIQGDERDVIIVSVGYGRDGTRKLSLNFGPVNREGGERRLNVLMSRARERCVVFSNFTAADLPVESTTAKGLRTLKSFLEFAETRRLTADEPPQEDTDSPFEDAVAKVLHAHGHEVRQQVGCAGFRVDLAVVDPQQRGRYLVGIECDGAKYHSSPVARDRDRLRQQILENLGWTIHRIWSTDWYRNRHETIARLLRAISDADDAPRREILSNAAADIPYASSFTSSEYEEEYAVYDYTPTEVAPALIADDSAQIALTASVVGEPHEAMESFAVPISQFDDIPLYEVCKTLRIAVTGDLHDVAPEYLAAAVEDVVSVEGPVHVDEVVRRIRTLWGLQRAGNRIREAIARGVQIAIVRGAIRRDADFLVHRDGIVRLRRRNGDPPARVDLISDAEIAEAIKHVLRNEFATPRADLINAAARRLGIQATSSAVATRVDAVIAKGIGTGWREEPTGRVELLEG